MIAAVFLVVTVAFLWLTVVVIQLIAALSLIAMVVGLVVAASAYGFSFLGFYYILGPHNTGWAIFAAMLLGTVIVRALLNWLKQAIGSGKSGFDEPQPVVYSTTTGGSPGPVSNRVHLLKGKHADRA